MKYPNYMMLIMALSAVMAMVYDSDAFYSTWALSIFVFSGASALSVRNTKKVFLWIPIVVLSVVGLVITFF
ncbi:hypothetical protein [Geomicrobium sediminis]|uniref:Uncharacterized protein n=1 Tax=Geomicrobium sediminis TaxID=1347788 RepID=A0ABS2P9K0_9BACL|nr:hypothetical protein [Geomicrobium sediminis]MBM7632088.1 hypothetical protein [Geomicrobium sediminis]